MHRPSITRRGPSSPASLGLPGLNGFVGEFLVLSGSYPSHARWTAAATIGVILSAAYMLWMVQRVFYGTASEMVTANAAQDLNGREHIALWPMAVLMLVMGVASPYWMRAIDGQVTQLVGMPTPAHTHAIESGQASADAAQGPEKQ